MKVEEAKERKKKKRKAELALISAGKLLVEYKSHCGPSFMLMTV